MRFQFVLPALALFGQAVSAHAAAQGPTLIIPGQQRPALILPEKPALIVPGQQTLPEPKKLDCFVPLASARRTMTLASERKLDASGQFRFVGINVIDTSPAPVRAEFDFSGFASVKDMVRGEGSRTWRYVLKGNKRVEITLQDARVPSSPGGKLRHEALILVFENGLSPNGVPLLCE